MPIPEAPAPIPPYAAVAQLDPLEAALVSATHALNRATAAGAWEAVAALAAHVTELVKTLAANRSTTQLGVSTSAELAPIRDGLERVGRVLADEHDVGAGVVVTLDAKRGGRS